MNSRRSALERSAALTLTARHMRTTAQAERMARFCWAADPRCSGKVPARAMVQELVRLHAAYVAPLKPGESLQVP
jgi:hypothetical protein